MTLFSYLDTLARITGPEVIVAAKRQAGPIQDRLPGDLDSLNRWDTLAGRQEGGSTGRIRYSALCQLTAYAMDGKVDRRAVREVFILAALDGHGSKWGEDRLAFPVETMIASDDAADAAFQVAR